jgi:hypothetical protein
VPVPLNPTFCGLPPPLSYTETSAVRLPFTNGLNVTLIKQIALEATFRPHVLVSAKSFASIPVMEMLVMFTAAPPLLVSVIFLARLLVPTGWLPADGWLLFERRFDAKHLATFPAYFQTLLDCPQTPRKSALKASKAAAKARK